MTPFSLPVYIGVSAGSGSLASESDRGSCGERLVQKVGTDPHCSEAPVFATEDRVWLSTRNLPLRLPCWKLGPRFLGPFKVLRRVNEACYSFPPITALTPRSMCLSSGRWWLVRSSSLDIFLINVWISVPLLESGSSSL
jgi:hypothetical protein